MDYKVIETIGLLLFIMIFAACTPKDPTNGQTEILTGHSLPNIVYILADDLGYGDLSCYGQKKFSTPNIDRLAATGMLFTQHYAGNTVCAPSRSALMTGQHTGHTFIRGNKEVRPEGQYPIPDSLFLLPEALKAAGYTTGAFGKWGLGFPGSEGDPVNQGFDAFFGYNCQRLGHHYYPYHLWDNQKKLILEGNIGTAEEEYAPNLIHEKALEFIEENRNDPFFLYIPTIIPHAELAAPDSVIEKYMGRFEPEKSYKGEDGGEKFRNGPYGSQEHTHAAFAAMIEILDHQVGEIIRKLDELGLSDHTLVIFTSDNGPHKEGGADPDYFDSNGPLRGYKRDLYEGGIRVPMIAKWPNVIEAGTTTDHLSAFWDVFPTLMDIVGAPAPEGSDGISFLPTLKGEPSQQKVHEYLYWEFHELGGRVAVRKGQWKAVRYDINKDPDAPIALYNLENDLSEQNNIADQYPEIVKEMKTLFKTARTPSKVFSFDQETFLNIN